MDCHSSESTCRINNWNNAGVWVVFGLIGAPLLAFKICMGLFQGEVFVLTNDQGESGAYEIGATIVVSVMAVAAFTGVFFIPVFWIEFGDRLTFRKLLGVRIREWTDVKSMVFEVDKTKIILLKVPGCKVTIDTHRFLVIEMADDVELRVRVPNKQVEQIQDIAAAHGHPLDDPLAVVKD